jgi:hypothetical protein
LPLACFALPPPLFLAGIHREGLLAGALDGTSQFAFESGYNCAGGSAAGAAAPPRNLTATGPDR